MNTVAYKFGTRLNSQLSPKEGINLHLLHAKANNGKVLFTTDKFPRASYRDSITKIILLTRDGSFAVTADVIALGQYSTGIVPPEAFTVPSVFNNENNAKKGWFALQNLNLTTIHVGDYLSVNGKDLLKSISGSAYMVYIDEQEQFPESQRANIK